MKHKYKGLKENPVIFIEKKIYKHQIQRRKKKSKKIHGSLDGIHLSCIRHGAVKIPKQHLVLRFSCSIYSRWMIFVNQW